MAQVVLSTIGTAIGGPIGGTIGSYIGGYIDGQLFPVKTQGPRLTDLSVTSSAYGQAIPVIFGSDNRIAGNVIWSTGLLETIKKVKTSGKGGPAVKNTEYSYRVSFATALGTGYIKRIKKVWANQKLIYDVDGPSQNSGLYSAMRVYPGDHLQNPDPTIEAHEGMGNVPAYRGTAYVVFADFQLADYGNRLPTIEFLVEADPNETVGGALREIVTRCGIDHNTVSFGRYSRQKLRGMVIASSTSGDGAIQPLSVAFGFDTSDQGGNLRITPRGLAPTAIISLADLGGHEAGDEVPTLMKWSRLVETQMPRQSSVTFSDPERDFQPNSQIDMRSEGSAQNNIDTQLALTLTADEGRSIASRLLWEAWYGRQTATCAVTERWRSIVAGRSYLVETPAGLEPLRVTRKARGINGVIELEVSRDSPQVYRNKSKGASSSVPENNIKVTGPVRPFFLDIPILIDDDDRKSEGFYFGAATIDGVGIWRGVEMHRALSGSDNFESYGTCSYELTVGLAAADYPPMAAGYDPDTQFDDTSEILVRFWRGAKVELESVSDAALLQAANALYIGPPLGAGMVRGGEILQFGEAELLPDGLTWKLTHLKRGQKGTEAEARVPRSAGAVAILLEPGALQRASFGYADINQSRQYKAVPLLQTVEDQTAFSFTNTGIGERPYAPTALSVAGSSGSDLTLAWERRSRVGWPALNPPPLAEETEAYELRIMNAAGTSVVRSVPLTSPTFTYTTAQQIADFGAVVTSLRWRVAQVSATYGNGAFAEKSGAV